MLEIKINKIRSDIDQKLQEETRTDKVQSSSSSEKITVNNNNQNKSNNKSDHESKKDSNKTKRFCTIDGFKYRNDTVKIVAQKEKIVYEDEQKGNVLDVKK